MTGVGDPPARPRPPVPGLARLVAMTIAVLVALAVLLSLGTWQVRRLAWKEDLIARVEARVGAEPLPLPAAAAWPSLTPDAIEYQPVTLSGQFDHTREVHVFISLSEPKGGPLKGQGYFVLTPLRLASGAHVFVNRGFVPLDRKDPASRPETLVTGDQTVTGLMRPAEAETVLSPAPNLAKNVWFVRDPAAMAAAVGLDPATVAPFTVDQRAGAALPQGGETVVRFTNNHLGYAITWYGLAAALVAVWAAVVLKRRRRAT